MVYAANKQTLNVDNHNPPSLYSGNPMLSVLTQRQLHKKAGDYHPPISPEVREAIQSRSRRRNATDRGRPSTSRGETSRQRRRQPPPPHKMKHEDEAARLRLHRMAAHTSNHNQGAEAMVARWAQGTSGSSAAASTSSSRHRRPPTRRRREEDETPEAAAARWAYATTSTEKTRRGAMMLDEQQQPPPAPPTNSPNLEAATEGQKSRRRERLQKAANANVTGAARRLEALAARYDDNAASVRKAESRIFESNVVHDGGDGRPYVYELTVESEDEWIAIGDEGDGPIVLRFPGDDDDDSSDEGIGSDHDTVGGGGAPVFVADRTAEWVESMRPPRAAQHQQPPSMQEQLSKPVGRAVAWVSSLWKRKPEPASTRPAPKKREQRQQQQQKKKQEVTSVLKRPSRQPQQYDVESDCGSDATVVRRPSARTNAWVAEAQKQQKKVQEDLLYHAMESDDDDPDCESIVVALEPSERTLEWAAGVQRRYQNFQEQQRLKQEARQRSLRALIAGEPTFADAVEVVAPSAASYAADAGQAGEPPGLHPRARHHQQGMTQEERQRHLRAAVMGRHVVEHEQKGKRADTHRSNNNNRTKSKAQRGPPYPVPERQYSLLMPDGTLSETGAKAIRLAGETMQKKMRDDRAVRFVLPNDDVPDIVVSPAPTPLTSGDEIVCAADETSLLKWEQANDITVHFVLDDGGATIVTPPPTPPPAPVQVEQSSKVDKEQRAERAVSREMKLLMETINEDLADITAARSKDSKK